MEKGTKGTSEKRNCEIEVIHYFQAIDLNL